MPKAKATEGPRRQKLTKTVCDRATYPSTHDPSTELRFVLWDSKLPGFGLRVYPSGRKVFVVAMKVRGRQRWVTLGEPGAMVYDDVEEKAVPLTLTNAHKLAKRHRALADAGTDPVEERKRQRAKGTTVADLASAYIEEARTRKRDPVKPSTVESYKSYAAHLEHAFGRRLPRTITADEVKDWYDDMGDQPTGANRRLWFLSALMDDAARAGLLAGPNPCRAAVGRRQKYREMKRKRYLKADELARLGNALRDLEGQPGGVSATAAGVVRLMLATGCRKGEALKAKWEDIDIGEAVWHIPDAKAGPRDVLLNASALAVLATLPRVEGNPYVFPGQKPGGRLTTIQTPWRRLCEAAKIDGCRPHDLRHTVGSWTVSSGASMEAVAGVLGHTETSTSERYAHMQDDPIREASERAGDAIFAALDGEANEPDKER